MYFRPKPILVVPLLACVCFAALMVAAGCRQRQSAPSGRATSAVYVGNNACAECHAREFEIHNTTRHARTLLEASSKGLGKLTPSPGKIESTSLEIGVDDGRLVASSLTDRWLHPLDLAIGSGKTGMNFVAFQNDGLIMMRMSYFPKDRRWHVTPGHEKESADLLGSELSAKEARRCLGCHAVGIPDEGRPEPKYPGVGCESCHGPGSEHVNAAKSGARSRDALAIADLGKLGATEVNQLCGRCHRVAESLNLKGPHARMTNRFQPYGLMLSECFKRSNNTLSCVTCHDPHEDDASESPRYENACKSCHSRSLSGTDHNELKQVAARSVCPVNPKSGCIPCHMPKRRVFESSTVPTEMADHLIAVYRNRK